MQQLQQLNLKTFRKYLASIEAYFKSLPLTTVATVAGYLSLRQNRFPRDDIFR